MVAEQEIGEEDVVLGPDFEGSADEEAGTIGVTAEIPFFHQQAADQEAAQDEEDVYASPAGVFRAIHEREDRMGGVVVDHEENSDATQEVEFDLAGFGEARLGRHLGSLAFA